MEDFLISHLNVTLLNNLFYILAQAIKVNGFVYTSGQIPIIPATGMFKRSIGGHEFYFFVSLSYFDNINVY